MDKIFDINEINRYERVDPKEVDKLLEAAEELINNQKNIAHFATTVQELTEVLGNGVTEELPGVDAESVWALVNSMNHLLNYLDFNEEVD